MPISEDLIGYSTKGHYTVIELDHIEQLKHPIKNPYNIWLYKLYNNVIYTQYVFTATLLRLQAERTCVSEITIQ